MTDERQRVPIRVLATAETAPQSPANRRRIVELDQRVKDALDRLGRASAQPTAARKGHEARVHDPLLVDVFDSGAEYRVLLELAGVEVEGIDLAMAGQEVRIAVTPRIDLYEGKGVAGDEPPRPRVSKCVFLQEAVVPEKSEAALNNGVLEVVVPKRVPTHVSRHRVIR